MSPFYLPDTERRLQKAEQEFRLYGVARPARYGFKDQTRLDHRIRDTWEIAKSRISIDQPRWKETLLPQLDRIRRDLELEQRKETSGP